MESGTSRPLTHPPPTPSDMRTIRGSDRRRAPAHLTGRLIGRACDESVGPALVPDVAVDREFGAVVGRSCPPEEHISVVAQPDAPPVPHRAPMNLEIDLDPRPVIRQLQLPSRAVAARSSTHDIG